MQQQSDIVRFDPGELQTLRGALNTTEELTLRLDGPPAGVFDPVRLPMLRDLNEWLAKALEDVSMGGTTGDMRLMPSEQVTARQAIGAIEALTTTDAGQQQLEAVGIRPSRQDIPTLSALLDKIAYPNPEDLAGTDLRYRLNTDPFSELNESSGSVVYYVYSQHRRNVLEGETRSREGQESLQLVSSDLDDIDPAGLNDSTVDILDSYYDLSWALARATHLPDSARQEAKDRALLIADDFLDIMERRDFATAADRYRLDLAAGKAAYALDRGYDSDPMLTLVDATAWTDYRTTVGLTD